jgi:hypothetical protein
MEGEVMRIGFFATRLVEARDEAQAEVNAIQRTREDKALACVVNKTSDPPIIYCENIVEYDPLDPSSPVHESFVLFPEQASV